MSEYGVPVALNVGDLLVGDGYRLLAGCGVDAKTTAELIRIAATGHRRLCLGQGAELAWMRAPAPPTTDQVIEIFRQKTSPAFQVALGIGAALAGADAATQQVLSDYSDALGIAYQIRDDLEDQAGFSAPSLLLALACDKAKASGRDRVMTAWRNGPASEDTRAAYRTLIATLGVEDRARELLEAYKEEAIRSLPALQNPSLKGLLRRVIGKDLPRGDQGLVQ